LQNIYVIKTKVKTLHLESAHREIYLCSILLVIALARGLRAWWRLTLNIT